MNTAARIITAITTAALIAGAIYPATARATEPGAQYGETDRQGTSEIALTVPENPPENISVEIPTRVNFTLSEDGNDFITPTVRITNNGTGTVNINHIKTTAGTIDGKTLQLGMFDYDNGGTLCDTAWNDATDSTTPIYAYDMRVYKPPITNPNAYTTVNAHACQNGYYPGTYDIPAGTENNYRQIELNGKCNQALRDAIGAGKTATIGTIEWTITAAG